MYDVIIIGSGIAGSYTAAKLKKFNILVIEREKEIKVKDSGLVSEGIFEFFHGNTLIKDRINRINFVSQSNNMLIEREKPFAYILEREEFLGFLRNRVEDITVFETAKEVQQSEGFVTVKTDKNEYQTKMLIGADGANSIVRKIVTDKTPRMCTGIMSNINNQMHHDCINVYFNKYFSPDFFSWAIPQNNEYGLITSIRPMEYFNYFSIKMKIPEGRICASMIPIGSTKSYSDRILLVGDSCGQVKPLTGGGIIFSLKAAKHVIETIKDAFKEDDFSKENLKYYEWAWKRDFGNEIRKQLFFRNLYRNLTNAQVDKLIQDFGPAIENAVKREDFDYDNLSKLWLKMPKFKLLKFLLGHYISD
jgi:flavin-dependent dehydrogenase